MGEIILELIEFIESYSIGKLGINLNNADKEIILGDKFVLNQLNTYEFNFVDKNIDKFNLIATLPAIIIDLHKVILTSNNDDSF